MSKKLWIGLLTGVLLWPALVWGADEIDYNGAVTIGQGIFEAGAFAAFEVKTKIKFKSYKTEGTGVGLKQLEEGKINLCGIGRSLKPEEKQKGLVSFTIGYDALSIFVHKNNPVNNLSKEQIKGIFSGKIKNWKEVGGKNTPVRFYVEPREDSQRGFAVIFREVIMGDTAYGSPARTIRIFDSKLKEIAEDENGMAAAPYNLPKMMDPAVRDKVKAISINGIMATENNVKSGAYIINRNLALVTKGLPKGQVKQFIDFMLSAEGQAVVAKNFVSVRR